jgi:hypothetical protein
LPEKRSARASAPGTGRRAAVAHPVVEDKNGREECEEVRRNANARWTVGLGIDFFLFAIYNVYTSKRPVI